MRVGTPALVVAWTTRCCIGPAARLDVAHDRAGTTATTAPWPDLRKLTLLARCGGSVDEALRCEHGSERVEFGDLELVRGPGLAGAGPRWARIRSGGRRGRRSGTFSSQRPGP